MTESWYEVAFGAHYPLIYGHRNQAEAQACLQLLPRLAPLNCRDLPVLDLGCGDGRHLHLLKKTGLTAIGLDLSTSLLNIAGERAEEMVLVRGDMRRLPFAERSLGSVLSLFTAFGYFGALPQNNSMVQEVGRVLAPGGHWYLDYFNCDQVRRELGSGKDHHRQRRIESLQVTEVRRYWAADGVVTKEVYLESVPGIACSFSLPEQGLSYTEKVAVFSLEEMDNLAREHGLLRVASAGSYEGIALGEGDRWILVYRKEQG